MPRIKKKYSQIRSEREGVGSDDRRMRSSGLALLPLFEGSRSTSRGEMLPPRSSESLSGSVSLRA